MNKSLLFLLLLIFSCSTTAFAQTSEEEAQDDLDYYNNSTTSDYSGDRSGKLWYGTGAILGFNSNTVQSNFVLGLTPIVGYKLNNWLSVGPRAGITYNRIRFASFNSAPDEKYSFIEWSAGPFARALVYRGIFVHAEYSVTSEATGIDQNTNEVVKSTRFTPFLGAGLQQGGGIGATGFEVLILFRLSQAELIGDRPFEIRTGINYNF
ncbi:hypothetical protein [Lewinella sp. 4G2]|uniref:hypothetical protein n=1 Tax=Lewinella sp. 4G2 TaxID=1803372 RepID=UPI0007B47527|nr:hypothetical protein [Lewinella sp. 4G2]OAV42808.1 hypothetical protein A3850_016370 [Lewinella sp. 4G2]